jgi:hypothetical protein
MGTCCTSATNLSNYTTIDNCNTIDEVIDAIEQLKTKLPLERKLISENIDNPNFTLPNEISQHEASYQLTPSDKRKRISHLENIERLYGNVLDLLNTCKLSLPLPETKKHLHSICSHYTKLYDENKTYNITFDKFRTFVEKHSET